LHDLCTSKLIAGREKDFEYVATALDSRLVAADTLATRLLEVPDVDPRVREKAVRWLAGRVGRRQPRGNDRR
jgi:hypothetical protein